MRVFLVAGEPSGDRLGGALMAGLKALCPEVTFEGVGGPLMQAEGMQSLFPMDELSVMGIAEVLPKYRHLKRRMHQTAEAVIAARPDVLITIDSPDFCLRVAKEVKAKSDIRIVHYVAPSVWAWRPKRAEKMAKVVDQVLAVLPFEPPYMEAVGLRCDFVGHPVVSEPIATDAEVATFREMQGIGDAPILLALPGSRKSEVARLMPGFGAVAARVAEARPDLRVVLPAAGPVVGGVRDLAQDWAVPPIIIAPTEPEAKRAAFRAADVALAASGTVSLELAANATPMVIAYDMSWLSWQIMSRAALIDTVTLVNLVSETRVVPEFLGPAFRPEDIAPAVLNVLEKPAVQRDAMALTMERLGRGNEAPGMRAARAVLEGMAGVAG